MIYLDNAATTPVHLSFRKQADAVMERVWGNPSSPHKIGGLAASLLQTSRALAAKCIGTTSDHIIFTSGGSESNALALNGREVYASAVEHHSILLSPGVHILPVDSEGLVKEGALAEIPDGALVQVQMVNSETGVWQDIKRLAKLTHNRGALFHCDAVQGFPHFRIDVEDLDVDFLSISGHKFGCAPGVGLLYTKDPSKLIPMLHNTQEFGARGGTENLPYISAMAKEMAEVVKQDYEALEMRYMDYENYLTNFFRHEGLDFRFNGTRITYAILNISFRGVDALQLVQALSEQNIYVSTGSACASHEAKPSHILEAMQVPADYIDGSIRLSFSPETNWDDIKYGAQAIAACVKLLGGN